MDTSPRSIAVVSVVTILGAALPADAGVDTPDVEEVFLDAAVLPFAPGEAASTFTRDVTGGVPGFDLSWSGFITSLDPATEARDVRARILFDDLSGGGFQEFADISLIDEDGPLGMFRSFGGGAIRGNFDPAGSWEFSIYDANDNGNDGAADTEVLSLTFSFAAVPAPSGVALFGGAGLLCIRRRRSA